MLLFPKKQVTTYTKAIDKSPPSLLAYDFEINQDEITIFYFDHNGIITKKMKPPFTIKAIQEMVVAKKKEVIINGNKKFFLSDQGRGVGFSCLVSEPIR